ncbi:uncharacterized protein BO66DRAFT_304587, partial [Aspergillus aculeatinus CBS 121060]
VQSNEHPRIVSINPQDQASPDYLINSMNRLHVQTEKASNKNTPKPGGIAAMNDVDAAAPLFYLGYTFFKATPTPGKKSTWSQVERAKMNLSQSDLMNMVVNRTKKLPVAEQYHSLSKAKRAHVDQLIHELRSSGPRFEWACVYVKEDEKPVRGKNTRRGDYETVSLEVIIRKKAASLVYPQVSVNEPVERITPTGDTFQAPSSYTLFNREPRLSQTVPPTNPLARHAGSAEPATHQGTVPARMADIQQPLPFRPNHQPPPPPPQHSFPTGVQRPIPQEQWAAWIQQGMPAAAHPQYRPSAGTHDSAATLTEHETQRGIPQMPTMWNDPRGASVTQGPVHRGPNIHLQPSPLKPPELHELGKTRAHTPTHPKPDHINAAMPVAEPETDLGMESSNVGDGESEFDFDDESSMSEGSDEGSEAEENPQPQPWRGSLYRRHSAPSTKQVYRTHYRKQPQKSSSNQGTGRNGYPAGSIDVVPAKSNHNDPRVILSREVTRPARDRPKIIQAPVPPEGLDMKQLVEERIGRYDGGRMRNDIRTRMLDDREARLEHRERLLDLKARVLEEEWDSACYLPRRMSLRDSGSFYARRY